MKYSRRQGELEHSNRNWNARRQGELEHSNRNWNARGQGELEHSNRNWNARGQLKIQQMAFVLVAIIIFFALVGLMFFSIRFKSLEKGVVSLKEEEASELVRKLAGSPELMLEGCSNCIDFDKVMALKGMQEYSGFWNLDYLSVRVSYPPGEKTECTEENYPNCNSISVIESADFGAADSAFVSVCRWDGFSGGYRKCEIGKILASGEGI